MAHASLYRSSVLLLCAFVGGCGGSGGSTVDADTSPASPVASPPATSESGAPDDAPAGASVAGEAASVTINGDAVDPDRVLEHVGFVAVSLMMPENNRIDGVPNAAIRTGASASASLTRPAVPFTVGEYLRSRAATFETCTRYEQGVAVEGHLADADIQPPTPLDGGEVLTIRSRQGSYAELVVSPDSVSLGYTSGEATLPLPGPEELIADIPGATFPALSGITIPIVEPLVVLGDSPERVLDRSFGWVPGSDPSATVLLSAATSSVAGGSHAFICIATDDGEFTAPEWAAAGLETETGAGFRTLQREVIALTVSGSTMAVGSSISSYVSIVPTGL